MSQIKQQDAINRAMTLIDNGYSASYVYEKLLKEGFNEEEAKGVLEKLTHQAFTKPSVSADSTVAPTQTEVEESTGFFRPQNFVAFGFLLLVLGFVLSFVLPTEWRIIAYSILVAGPVMMLFGAIRTSS